jgi:hypothetical protein
MHNRIIVGNNTILEKESDETIVIKGTGPDGKPQTVVLNMQQALEASHAFSGWVISAWLG